jgi:hypothetical protein
MVKAHRAVVERLGPGPVHGVLLDTPFGFQMNAAELAARAVGYFRDSVGAVLDVAGIRSRADLEGTAGDGAIAKLAAAPLVFAGPGSPTYALRQWRGTLVPTVLAEKLSLGGALTFSSAAALTLGVCTVPVYEVYKVGDDPYWASGLDLLGPLGLSVALIPHYNNAEGGTHDTRFCYLGEKRLRALERELPQAAFVLGVDEHTAWIVDLDTQRAEVTGHGGITVRVEGRSARIEAGATFPLARIIEMAADLAESGAARHGVDATPTDAAAAPSETESSVVGTAVPPLLVVVRHHEESFRAARDRTDVSGMVTALLSLDDDLWAWSADTLQSDALDRGRQALRAMVSELGRLAHLGARDPASVVGPFVDLVVALREVARREQRFADSDAARDRLAALGVEVRDAPGGSVWAFIADDTSARGDVATGGGPQPAC